MPNQRAKTGVTVVSVSQVHIHSGIRKKYQIQKLSNKPNWEEMRSISAPFDQYKSGAYSPTPIHSSIFEMHEISSRHGTNINHPRIMSAIKDKYHPVSTTSSFNNFLTLSKNDEFSTSLSRIMSIEQYRKTKQNRRSRRYSNPIFKRELKKPSKNIENNETKKRKQRRRIYTICPACSTCCCLSSIIGMLLFLFGIAAILVFIFTSKHITTITTTSTTSTTTTPAPPCAPTSVGSASTLYTTSSSNGTSYTCLAYEWTSPTTGLVTLAFEFRHDPNYWFLDDVSVYAGAVQMLNNTGFETGSLSPWIRTTPYGSCGGTGGFVSSAFSSHSGSYKLFDGSSGCADRISQQFTATAGQVYFVSFWLKSGSTGSPVSAKVTLS
ncbi:unnamed protein product [Rotaria sp. Silwood1]|nr:unnamed protein product [Rotaria sp. Silwood1]